VLAAVRRRALRPAHALLTVWWRLRRPATRGVKLVLRDGDGRVLFVRHTYGDREGWELPGGGLHRGEAPQDGARREGREELGLDLAWQGLGLLTGGGWGKVTTLHGFTALAAPGATVRIDRGELAEACWAPPGDPPRPLGRDAPAVLALLPRG